MDVIDVLASRVSFDVEVGIDALPLLLVLLVLAVVLLLLLLLRLLLPLGQSI